MRFYLVILSDIKDVEKDILFGNYVNDNLFEYWRYTASNWIIATPDSVTTNDINTTLLECYESDLAVVLEISINDVGGFFKTQVFGSVNPLQWFHLIRDKDYIPRWEKAKTSTQ